MLLQICIESSRSGSEKEIKNSAEQAVRAEIRFANSAQLRRYTDYKVHFNKYPLRISANEVILF